MFHAKQKAFLSSDWTRSGVSLGFTLVELIVVITILAILGTIAFISLQGFSRDARDSQRLSDIRVIEKGLSIYKTNGNTLPIPDDSITITASGTIIVYQGNVGTGILQTIGQAGSIRDPLLNEPYIYALTADKRNIQLLGFFEEDKLVSYEPVRNYLITPQTYAAVTRADLFPKSFGDPVGIFTSIFEDEPIQNQSFPGDTLDILDIGVTQYRAYLGDSTIEGTSDILILTIPNKSCKRILELRNSIGDGLYTINPSGTGVLEVYCDMTTDGGGWTFFGHMNNNSNGTDFFENGIGTYEHSRIDNDTKYSLGSDIFDDTEMMFTLDVADPKIAEVNNKVVFLKYDSSDGGFNTGPIPCLSLVENFSYKFQIGGDYMPGGMPTLCESANWIVSPSSGSYITRFHSTSIGNQWGLGMGGDASWNHDGWWYLR